MSSNQEPDGARSRKGGEPLDSTSSSPDAGDEIESTADEDGRVTRARELRRERHDQIQRAAERVFASKGFHAASISDVIEAAGTSRGTFYLYFDGKRAIFDALLDELFGKLKACVRPVDLTAEARPLEQLRANVACAMKVVAENRDLTRILYRTGQGVDPEVDRKVAAFNAGVTELIRRALRGGMQIGIVRQLDDQLVAQCIYGSLKEIVFHSLEARVFDDKPLAHIVDEILRYNIEGLRGP
jgi:AcrR family transcriptional regulator